MSDEYHPSEHIGEPNMWSYACQCLRCRWEQWWHEGDNAVIGMPDERHPEHEYDTYYAEAEKWSGWTQPNG